MANYCDVCGNGAEDIKFILFKRCYRTLPQIEKLCEDCMLRYCDIINKSCKILSKREE